MSNNLILLSVIQAICLSAGQVLLKIAMQTQPAFSWTWDYFSRTLTNWWLLACGLTFTGAGLLWMYILRHYPFSQAYPLSSLAYVFGMVAAMWIFHEQVSLVQWLGILLIMAGCYCVAN